VAASEQHLDQVVPSTPRGVVTPEAVHLEFDTAGVSTRIAARFIDIWVAMLVFYGGLAVAMFVTGSPTVAGLVGGFLAIFGYPAIAESWKGTTAGKSMVGVRVITVEGGPVRFRHAAIRSALQVVDLFLVPIGTVAIVSTLAGRDDQRLGDRLAGTLVVRGGAGFSVRARAVAFPPLRGFEAYVAALDISGIRPRHYELLRSFLTRVDELAPDARLQLGLRLVGPTATALGQGPPPGVHHEAFLVSVVAAYQQRHGGPATWMFGPAGAPAVGRWR
jgi:uncharacterized RDD family membrane protein YckC